METAKGIIVLIGLLYVLVVAIYDVVSIFRNK